MECHVLARTVMLLECVDRIVAPAVVSNMLLAFFDDIYVSMARSIERTVKFREQKSYAYAIHKSSIFLKIFSKLTL